MAPPIPPQAQQQQQADDPIYKFNLLIPRLKESLVNLMKIAGQSLHENAMTDDGVKTTESQQQQRFEKNLEEFYSVCDHIEINLRLALENVQQNADSAKYTPFVVNVPGENIQAPEGQTVQYSTYLSTVKTQISCAKEIHDLLMESAKKLSDV